ncbi:MAG: hypothetical protein R3C02_09370 [Planctomycetaceae bacterium]
MRLPCIAGRMNYLGKNGSAAGEDASHDHVILQWAADRDVTANTLSRSLNCDWTFIEHAECYYRKPDGTPTGETQNFRDALSPLSQLYRALVAAEFGPLKLKQVLERMIVSELSGVL